MTEVTICSDFEAQELELASANNQYTWIPFEVRKVFVYVLFRLSQ